MHEQYTSLRAVFKVKYRLPGGAPYDELLFEVPRKSAIGIAARVRETMEGVCRLDVPLKVRVGWGDSWAACHA